MGARLELAGAGVSPGVVVGPVFRVDGPTAPNEDRAAEAALAPDAGGEGPGRFHAAVEAVAARLEETARELASRVGDSGAEIFEAQAELARDIELAEDVERRLGNGTGLATAVIAAGEELAQALAESEDEYIAARAEDVRDVARQIVEELRGGAPPPVARLARPSIVVARALTPAKVASLAGQQVLAFVSGEGSSTSHVAILARALGTPAVVAVGTELERLQTGQTVAVDGTSGRVLVEPDDETQRLLHERRRAEENRVRELRRFCHREAWMGGRRIAVEANLGGTAEIEAALEWGAEGVGLLRTEFLFLERAEAPSEDEQTAVYTQVVTAFAPRPVTIRTLDIGGDKPLSFVTHAAEDNPFLGLRGIRRSLSDDERLFADQLAAILRAAAHGPVRVMFPMVSGLEEIRAAGEMLAHARRQLDQRGVSNGAVQLGIMVETPAAALCAGELAEEVDFFSIGTNDLTQYTLAADRGNQRLDHLHNPAHPAVLRLIGLTCEAARARGLAVGVCGDAAANLDLVPRLLQLGVGELSMPAPQIPAVKRAIIALGQPAEA